MKLHLFRHFAHQGREGAFYGNTDLNLKPRQKTALSLSKAIQIFSSPLLRCRQSMEQLNIDLFKQIDLAKEVDFGVWEGMTYSEIQNAYPREAKDWECNKNFTFPQGEKLEVFYSRIQSLAELINEQKEDVFLMTHGGVIRHLICHYLGLDYDKSLAFKVETGSLSTIEIFIGGLGVLNSLNKKEIESWQVSLL
jgi:alpha-ribazole phosphatase